MVLQWYSKLFQEKKTGSWRRKYFILGKSNSLPHQKLSVLRYFEVSVFLLFSVNIFDINGNEEIGIFLI